MNDEEERAGRNPDELISFEVVEYATYQCTECAWQHDLMGFVAEAEDIRAAKAHANTHRVSPEGTA